jgi:hypothetical protein
MHPWRVAVIHRPRNSGNKKGPCHHHAFRHGPVNMPLVLNLPPAKPHALWPALTYLAG